MINRNLIKNKVFFAGMLGLAPFYFYIFNRKQDFAKEKPVAFD
jgi:hypothetical protein